MGTSESDRKLLALAGVAGVAGTGVAGVAGRVLGSGRTVGPEQSHKKSLSVGIKNILCVNHASFRNTWLGKLLFEVRVSVMPCLGLRWCL